MIRVTSLHDKGSGSINEDFLLLSSPLFGVFDGASGLIHYHDSRGRTGGLIASSLVSDEVGRQRSTLLRRAEEANSQIMRSMIEAGVDVAVIPARWATTAAVIRIQDRTFDWLQIGDSLILLIYEDGSHRLLVTDYEHDRETLLLWKKFADNRTKQIRSKVQKNMLEVRARMNTDYGGLNGDPAMIKFLRYGKEKLQGLAHILLFTDGLFLPKEDPRKPDDWKSFVSLYLKGGLQRILTYVRRLETEDELCWKYPRFRQYDDATAVALTIV